MLGCHSGILCGGGRRSTLLMITLSLGDGVFIDQDRKEQRGQIQQKAKINMKTEGKCAENSQRLGLQKRAREQVYGKNTRWSYAATYKYRNLYKDTTN